MLNITHYQRNANQNHNEVPLHASQDGCYPKVYSVFLLAPDQLGPWKETQKQEEGGHTSSQSQLSSVFFFVCLFLAPSLNTVIPAMLQQEQFVYSSN